MVQPNPQHTSYQVKEDETDEDVFFEEFNSGFLETSRSLDSTLPQGESSARKEWVSRRNSTENHDFTSGTRDKAYTAGSPLDRPKSRDRVYSSPQNIDYFLDIKPIYTHGPEHPAAQAPTLPKADNIEIEPALTDSPELASAQDVSQGETRDNEAELILTDPAHTNSLKQIAAQELHQGGASDNNFELILTDPAHTNSLE